jgi:HEAT repeat protein
MQTLSDDDASVRICSFYALAAIGPDAAQALPNLIAALKDPDPEIRLAAVYAIPAVTAPDDSAIPDLKAALGDPDPRVQAEVDMSLRKLELSAKHRNHYPAQSAK